MASGPVNIYDSAPGAMQGVDLLTEPVIVTLHTNSYTPSAAHNERADLTNQLGTAFGYTQNSHALAGKAFITVTQGTAFASSNLGITATGGDIPAWRYAVMSLTGTFNGLTDPLIGYWIGDTTPADIPATPDGQILTLVVPTGGWVDFVRATWA